MPERLVFGPVPKGRMSCLGALAARRQTSPRCFPRVQTIRDPPARSSRAARALSLHEPRQRRGRREHERTDAQETKRDLRRERAGARMDTDRRRAYELPGRGRRAVTGELQPPCFRLGPGSPRPNGRAPRTSRHVPAGDASQCSDAMTLDSIRRTCPPRGACRRPRSASRSLRPAPTRSVPPPVGQRRAAQRSASDHDADHHPALRASTTAIPR